jgi:hypothetical protein
MLLQQQGQLAKWQCWCVASDGLHVRVVMLRVHSK